RVSGFVEWCRSRGLPDPVAEYRFRPPRRWRFDYCWPEHHVALEEQGGLFSGGRHTRGAALLHEHEKLNAAAVDGYRVLYCTPQTIRSREMALALGALLGHA
ncbi:MAG TPA: hypothetical protein VN717_08655, partial [Gemmatimonadaceae bacterium]|nr:hypothetical protein [Gemmatimonadaceae bacterium]